MYFADSLLYAIFAYDFDTESGQISRKRVFARTHPPGFPDGSTVDADGYLWNAEFNSWRVVRYAPDGRIDHVIELPVQLPTSCAFGGPNLDVLYVTTASQKMTAGELEAQPMAGALLALDVGVSGVPEPRFAFSSHNHVQP
jgi:sugar lactone lactonase YvrE